jgi:hypothetical protein
MMSKIWGLLLSLTVVSCISGECRRKEVIPPYPGQKEEPSTSVKKGGAAVVPAVERRVLVYKYDGSLQCGMGKGKSVKEMAKELEGIKIFSAVKKPDGLMHIQVCGSNTGMTNVYEILASDLPEAERKGFKLWKFE